jgi:hypothetical protein
MYDVEAFPGEAYLNILYNAPIRNSSPDENNFFLNNMNVAGYAADDGNVVQNPYKSFNNEIRNPIAANGTIRQALRSLPENQRPDFNLTAQQQATLGAYSPNQRDIKDTILARIITGDSSAQDITPEQRQAANQAVNQTYNYLGIDKNHTWKTPGVLDYINGWQDWQRKKVN